jgi:hypothetical protein
MPDNRVSCYSVKVEIPNEVGWPAARFYLVSAGSQTTAITAVEGGIPGTWGAMGATLTAVRRETVKALDLRPGIPRPISGLPSAATPMRKARTCRSPSLGIVARDLIGRYDLDWRRFIMTLRAAPRSAPVILAAAMTAMA